MPTIVIYQNTYHQMSCMMYENQYVCFTAVQNYMKSLDIYNEEYQHKLCEAQCLRDLMNIIETYNIEELSIYKVYDKDSKELK